MRMLRLAALCAVMALMMGCAAGNGTNTGATLGGEGEWFQLCTCLGGPAEAGAMAGELLARVPGAEVMIVPAKIGVPGSERLVHEIHVRHPSMAPGAICDLLGRLRCPKASSPGS